MWHLDPSTLAFYPVSKQNLASWNTGSIDQCSIHVYTNFPTDFSSNITATAALYKQDLHGVHLSAQTNVPIYTMCGCHTIFQGWSKWYAKGTQTSFEMTRLFPPHTNAHQLMQICINNCKNLCSTLSNLAWYQFT